MKYEIEQLLKVFIAACLAAAATYGGSVLTLGATQWRAVVAAGIAAVVVAAYKYVMSLKAVDLETDLLLVFIGTALGQLVTMGSHVLNLGAGDWKAILGAAIAAAIVAAYNWLSPTNVTYGVGRKSAFDILLEGCGDDFCDCDCGESEPPEAE